MATTGPAPRPRVRNPRGQGGHLRQELTAAALRLLDARGEGALTLRAVARETGVAAPSIYGQFSNAEALMAEIGHQCFVELGQEMVVRRDEFQDPLARLLACCRAYVDFALRHPHRYALLFQRDTSAVAPEPPEADKAGAAVFDLFLTAVVARTGESGDAAITTAAAIWSGVDGYARLCTHRAHFDWPDQETMLHRIIGDHIRLTPLG